jgi:hypothetical protein
VQYQLKWFAIRHLYEVMLSSQLPGRPSTSVNLVASLCSHLQARADGNEARTMISRESFINALLGKYGSRMQDSKVRGVRRRAWPRLTPPSLMRVCTPCGGLGDTTRVPPLAQANLIFSTFDPMNINRIHYANVVACLIIFEHPSEPPRKKLQKLFRLYSDHRCKEHLLIDP